MAAASYTAEWTNSVEEWLTFHVEGDFPNDITATVEALKEARKACDEFHNEWCNSTIRAEKYGPELLALVNEGRRKVKALCDMLKLLHGVKEWAEYMTRVHGTCYQSQAAGGLRHYLAAVENMIPHLRPTRDEDNFAAAEAASQGTIRGYQTAEAMKFKAKLVGMSGVTIGAGSLAIIADIAVFGGLPVVSGLTLVVASFAAGSSLGTGAANFAATLYSRGRKKRVDVGTAMKKLLEHAKAMLGHVMMAQFMMWDLCLNIGPVVNHTSNWIIRSDHEECCMAALRSFCNKYMFLGRRQGPRAGIWANVQLEIYHWGDCLPIPLLNAEAGSTYKMRRTFSM